MIALLFAVALMIGIIAFGLGYNAADKQNIKIAKNLKSQLRLAHNQRHQLAEWVRKNWPNEYTAYHNGVEEGYQAGLYHAPALMEEAEALE